MTEAVDDNEMTITKSFSSLCSRCLICISCLSSSVTCRTCSSNLPLFDLVSVNSFCRPAHMSSADSHFLRHSSWLLAKPRNSPLAHSQYNIDNSNTVVKKHIHVYIYKYTPHNYLTFVRIADQIVETAAEFVEFRYEWDVFLGHFPTTT